MTGHIRLTRTDPVRIHTPFPRRSHTKGGGGSLLNILSAVATLRGEVVQVQLLDEVVADPLHHVRLVVRAVQRLGHVDPVEQRRQDAEHGGDQRQKYDAKLPQREEEGEARGKSS